MENKTGGGQGMEGRSCCSPKDRTQQLQAPIISGNCSATQHQPYPFTASLHRCSDGQILLWISTNKVKDRSRQPEEYLARGSFFLERQWRLPHVRVVFIHLRKSALVKCWLSRGVNYHDPEERVRHLGVLLLLSIYLLEKLCDRRNVICDTALLKFR